MYWLVYCRPGQNEPVTLTEVPRNKMGEAALVARLLWREFHGQEVAWEDAPRLAKREERRRERIASSKEKPVRQVA